MLYLTVEAAKKGYADGIKTMYALAFPVDTRDGKARRITNATNEVYFMAIEEVLPRVYDAKLAIDSWYAEPEVKEHPVYKEVETLLTLRLRDAK